MRHVTSHDPAYLRTWVLESCRAELVHWLAIPPALLFFLWNPWPVGLLMILYALAVNGPCIVAQRYNRPRFLALLEKNGPRAGRCTGAGSAPKAEKAGPGPAPPGREARRDASSLPGR